MQRPGPAHALALPRAEAGFRGGRSLLARTLASCAVRVRAPLAV